MVNGVGKIRGQCENNDEDNGFNGFFFGEEKVMMLRFYEVKILIYCC